MTHNSFGSFSEAEEIYLRRLLSSALLEWKGDVNRLRSSLKRLALPWLVGTTKALIDLMQAIKVIATSLRQLFASILCPTVALDRLQSIMGQWC
jgi:hypothetical protein